MEVVAATRDLTRILADARRDGRTVGLVPTMGALHRGHRSLIDRAVTEHGHSAVSIFVNPSQFRCREDYEEYPKTLERDLDVCRDAGVSTVFAPPVNEMFPDWPTRPATTVTVRGVSEGWEGRSRPGHFDGVATVVAKLLSIVGECSAYFGEKDYQQLLVVQRLVADLSMPVAVVVCPTVREPDGLALSSRNLRLRPAERRAAAVLQRALRAGTDAMSSGEHQPEKVAATMAAVVETEPLASLDYAAAVDARDLRVPPDLDGLAVRLLVAARVGPVRLIDNCAGPLVPARVPS